MRLGEPSAALAGVCNQSVNGETQSVASVDAAQYDYLMNENRRLLSIIDQYKYWESTYAAAYANVTAAAAANTSEIDGQLPGQHPAAADSGESQESVQCAASFEDDEATRLRSELERIRKEHDDLISLLADQNLKMQQYERHFKDLGQNVSG